MIEQLEKEISETLIPLKNLKQKYTNTDRKTVDNYEQESEKYDYVKRDGFTRDRDRILFSRAFRRLEHKAQIYTHEKGDHFRTRLTHSLEVMQISRSIARNIEVDETLAEAIALGHDIGHTPFGHQGERTLDNILRGVDDLGRKINYSRNVGGFKHNIHSIRVLEKIEVKDEVGSGLNLTWQVLDGILKHTSTHKKNMMFDLKSKFNHDFHLEADQYLDKFDLPNYFLHKTPLTLEGQIVKVADEIAQRQHDLDDGFRDKELSLNLYSIVDQLLETINAIDKNIESKSAIYIEQIENLNNLEERLELIKNLKDKKENSVLLSRMSLVRDIINFFIKDVTLETHALIGTTKISKFGTKLFIHKELVSMSLIGNQLNNKIEELINNEIVNSYDVNRFDGKAVFIIRQIFKAYFENPSQMPPYMLKRLMNQIDEHKMSKELYFGTIEGSIVDPNTKLSSIDFRKTDKLTLKKFISILQLKFDELQFYTEEETYHFKSKEDKTSDFGFTYYHPENAKYTKKQFESFFCDLNRIYLTTIADHIAGMTDNYAKSEYRNLYLV